MSARSLRRISEKMTGMPFLTFPQTSVEACLRFMRKEGFSHLPVIESGKVVGVVSERDLRGKAGGAGTRGLKVSDVMSRGIYAAVPGEPLVKVVRTMARRKIGSCVVVERGRGVTGIFTLTDALNLLGDLLDEEAPPELRLAGIEKFISRNARLKTR